MGLKLVGEYQVTDDGVVIEGQLKDSKIHEVASLLKPFGTITLFAGQGKDGISEKYNVPNPKFRPYILHNGLLKRDDEKEFVKIEGAFSYDGNAYYRDGSIFYANLGVQYNHGAGCNIIDQANVASFTARNPKKRLITNSAWIWNVANDGSFKVKLRGLANRHMMTMVIGNAAKMANHIQLLAEKLLDKSEMFTRAAIDEHGGLY